MNHTHTSARVRLLGLLAVVTLAAAACGAKAPSTGAVGGTGSTSGSGATGQTVSLAVNSWVGSQADVSIACYALQQKLHDSCNQVTIDEVPTWPAMAQGKIDGVLEVWGHEDLYKQYVTNQHTVVDGGLLGAVGHIGWYVPTYLMKAHPELATWKGLTTDWAMFKTAESGSAGQFLDGSPSYVTEDGPLIKNLGLNLKVIYAGSEAAEITAVRQAYAAHKPVLFYFYTPQWLNSQLSFSEVQLPPRTPGCDATAGQTPDKTDCAYPTYHLYKAFSTAFTKSNPKAYQILKNMTLTSQQQDQIAALIADQNMTPAAAATKWGSENPTAWQSW
jgi:glycine betaine/proline transport system substrate-binding protein